ncbi:PAC2 family protein [Mariniluteicoccus endophyticus]
MLDPRLLYQLNPAVWDQHRGRQPVMIHLLQGYIDAGQVGRTLAEHIRAQCKTETLVRFDVDQLHDYRSRRPAMVFDTDHWKSVEPFRLELLRATSPAGEDFLLLTGPEPDVQWERTAAAIRGLAQRLEVRLAVTAYGIPIGVPHTRPTLLTGHGTRPELSGIVNPVWVGRMEIPGSFPALLELELGQHGIDAAGIAANVPHYLSNSPFHQATIAALERLNEMTGLGFALGDLEERALVNLAEISREMEASPEVQEVVSQLEVAYDEVQDQTRPVPSADEIGAELERFLAEQNHKDDEGH